MGQILSGKNLVAYFTWRNKPWGVADLLYERLPMLAVRNYISAEDDQEWPLCWRRGRGLRRGLSLCIEFLRDWQAFRPGAARTFQKKLEGLVPKVAIRFQRNVVRKVGVICITAASKNRKKADQLVEMMSQAVAEISELKELKKPTPMLGSKVMHFFFPEFFPVWDTAVVKKALAGLSRRGKIELASSRGATSDRSGRNRAMREYAQYVNLMISDLRRTPRRDVERLDEKLIRHAIGEYGDRFLRDLLEENLGDRSPILFELCVIGYGRRMGVL